MQVLAAEATPAGTADQPGRRLDLDLRPQFHQPVPWNPEEPRRRRRVAVHEGEQLVAPDRHAAASPGDHRLAARKGGGVHRGSEERRGGKEWVSTVSTRGSAY